MNWSKKGWIAKINLLFDPIIMGILYAEGSTSSERLPPVRLERSQRLYGFDRIRWVELWSAIQLDSWVS